MGAIASIVPLGEIPVKAIIIVTVLCVSAAARVASAQVFISPFVDTTLSSPSATGSSSKPGFGVALGNVGKIIGAETETGYQPELIDNTANGLQKSRVITFSGNTLIGPTIGRVLGVRADVRYFRAYGFKVTDLQNAGLALDHFDFWRASLGFAAKF